MALSLAQYIMEERRDAHAEMRWRMGREKSRKRLRGALYLKAHLATLNSKQFRLKSFLRKCNSGNTALFASHKMRRKYLVKKKIIFKSANKFSDLLYAHKYHACVVDLLICS
jgi:hypothetical protein